MINHPSLWASVFLDTQIDAQATETYQIRSWNIQKKSLESSAKLNPVPLISASKRIVAIKGYSPA